ncbi:MAG TPA: DUF87 domain-containing protein [Polyangiaceae bacterium]|jgi:energy-coupling factor transporter ATP-binding protein EcfA2|nr:DUF87 domain-containing protein [Polyangiaceae bacterium]
MSHQFFDTSTIDKLAREIERLVDSESSVALFGQTLSKLVARIPSEEQVTPGAVIRLALLNDMLRIAEAAILADGTITDDEISYVEPLVRESLKYLGRFRGAYKDAFEGDPQGTAQFIQQHVLDRQMFGGKCKDTQWIGVSICRKAGELSGDGRFTDDYRDIALRTLDDLFDGVRSGPVDGKATIAADLMAVLPPRVVATDAREAAYCSPDSPEVFSAVAHANEVFAHDPFDVDTVHEPARNAFARMLSISSDARAGRMLLVKGDSGSGKTHLMRAFRNSTHGEQLGIASYMQMSTQVTNYARYILSNTLSSWEHPFWGNAIADSAIACLSESVARDLPVEEREALWENELPDGELDAVVNRGADKLLASGKYSPVHVDVVRMMLYLQRRDPARMSRVIKYLRCEQLSPYDQKLVGGIASFEGEEGPSRMLTELGKLISVTGNGAMVFLVDQVEDVFHLDDATSRFRLAMDALRHVTDHVPSSIVVIACLEDYYVKMRGALSMPLLDRLERDPEPVRLTAGRTLDEIEEILQRRLEHLFEHQNVTIRVDEQLYPFRHEQLVARINQRTRDVLDWARRHHEDSVHARRVVDSVDVSPPVPSIAPMVDLSRQWNDHRSAATTPPDDEASQSRLLAWCLERVGRELEAPQRVTAQADASFVAVKVGEEQLSIGLCNKAAQGGRLALQVEGLLKHASTRGAIPIVLRGTEYPPPGTSRIAMKLKEVLQAGGRRLVMSDADWRSLHALHTFDVKHGTNVRYQEWLKTERPLSGISILRAILALDDAAPAPRNAPVSPAAPPPSPSPSLLVKTSASTTEKRTSPGRAMEPFSIGDTRGLVPQELAVLPGSFVTHAAFLGSSGSGKTTLALRILEQLAVARVPVLMLDRKGDLCRYGSTEYWQSAESDPKLTESKRALAEKLDVRVYTPGEPRGRPLNLPVLPTGLRDLPAHERGMTARYAASALGAMMGYRKTSKSDETRLGILGKAIELVGRLPSEAEAGIPQLVAALDDVDPDLVSAVGKLDTKHFRALVENLETLRLRYEHVLRGEGDRLSPDLLFGMQDGVPGKTRVTIISTKFLGDNAAIEFWVARLLGELSRWASQRPAGSLQAVAFLDEADIYLPAQSKPATKEPMLDLLKRARSAGLGVFIATQSPGDLDYRCRDNIRTWFVGRVAEKTALEKMKPLLSECRINVGSKLASAKTGEFFRLNDGDVVEFKAMPSVMKTEQLAEDEIIRIARPVTP